MRKLLVIKSFEKAANSVHSDVVSQQSVHISDTLFDDYKFTVNERTLRNYYNKAMVSTDEDISISKSSELYLSKYLGYENYSDFLSRNGLAREKGNVFMKALFIGGPIVLFLMGYFVYGSFKKDCMVWTNNDHYEKVKCEEKGGLESMVLNSYLVEHFKRVDPDCDYPFFKIDGGPNLWYEKNVSGTLEYFTYHGLHPITGKTLKGITEYMIKKHICDSIH